MYDDLQLELENSSTVDRAAEEIRRAMFAGQLEPGTPLREVALSEAMGVGRSTIREALGVLVAEGLAVRVPNNGVAVKELTADDVRDVSRARTALESAGVRRWHEADESDRAGACARRCTRTPPWPGPPERATTRRRSPRRTCRSIARSSASPAASDCLRPLTR